MIYINEDEYLESLEFAKPKYIKQTINRTVVKQENKEIVAKPLLEVNPIYRYSKDGELVDKYLNPRQMANKLRWREHSLLKAANQEKLYNGFILSKRNYTKEQFIERFRKPKKPKIKKEPKPKREKKIKVANKVAKPRKELICTIYQYNQDGLLVNTFVNAGVASRAIGVSRYTLRNYSLDEKQYNGYLYTRKLYNQCEAKERYINALDKRTTTFVYNLNLELVKICFSLQQVKEYIHTELTLKRIGYAKRHHKEINGYILSSESLK